MSIIPLTQSAVGVPLVIDDGHTDRVIDRYFNNFWIWFLMKLRVNLGLASICVYFRGKCRKFWSRENYDVRRSRLFMHDEPESSVRYRSSWKKRKFWLREKHDIRRSRLFMHDEPECSVRYRRSWKKCRKFWSRENYDVRRSRLFMHDEPECSGRYRSTWKKRNFGQERSMIYVV